MENVTKRSPVQDIIWEIMKTVKPILEDGGFRYYMLGGTLIGAIRHKGFIPWDDDIDIGLPRKDYETFLKMIPGKLPPYLELRTWQDDTPHHYYFSRIVDTRHEVKRTGSTVERTEDVWIDIFPLDGMPDNAVVRQIHKLRLLYARMRYHLSTFDKVNLKRPNRPLSERVIIWMVMHTGFGTRSDPAKWLNKVDKLLKKYSVEDTGWIVNFMGQYKFKEMFPKAWYGNGTSYPFEDSELIGPDEYDKVLTYQYGDYMTPPKDADRNTHASEFEG